MLKKIYRWVKFIYFKIIVSLRRGLYALGSKFPGDDGSYRLGPILFDPTVVTKDPWVYHNESWERVIHRWSHRRMVQKGQIVDVDDSSQNKDDAFESYKHDSFKILRKAQSEDRWVYLYLSPFDFNWRNYRWSFRMKLNSHFLELQFGIRYQDFYNRYRFRFQENRLFFDEVDRGRFYNDLASTDYHLELDRWYDVNIDIFEKHFSLFIDEREILSVKDLHDRFKTVSIALILWEKNEVDNISFEIENICIQMLTRIA